MGRFEGIRRIYKPLRWLLAVFLLGIVAVPLMQECILGIFQGKGCKFQPVWSFFTTNYPWIVLLLLMLVGLLTISWRAELHYQARQRFDLLKPATALSPEDLGFHVVGPSEDKPEEPVSPNQRPFHECSYVSRKAIPYHLRDEKDPQPQYTEEELVDLLQKGGFVLQGAPTDGKSHTLYEVIKRMDGYEVFTPKINEIPTDEDLELLLKGRKVVLLLDDLTNYVGTQLDLRELRRGLDRCQASWVVASNCRDGPELESVREAETNGLKSFYENIPKKLKLLEIAPEEKERLAHSIGREWHPEPNERYPTPGSITMEEYKGSMRERFERDLSLPEKDILRALKLLSRAGILPLTHWRVEAVLEAERLFNRHDVHLRDCPDKLREYDFLRSSPAPEVIMSEPAYLADDVVSYVGDREPEDDFDALMEILATLQDHVALFYLGNTYAVSLENPRKALEAYDGVLKASPDDANALNNRGGALSKLGEYEKALEAIDTVLEMSPNHAAALYNKGSTLGRMGEYEKALEAYDGVLKASPDDADALYNKGGALNDLGRYEESLEALDAALEIRPDHANALYSKGSALNKLGKYEKALESLDKALEIRPDYAEALNNKIIALLMQGREEEAIEHLCQAWRNRERLSDKGDLLARLFEHLGKESEECQ